MCEQTCRDNYLMNNVHKWKNYLKIVLRCAKSKEKIHESIFEILGDLPSSVNEALESLLDQIIDEYVNNWYESGISRDRDFLNEIRAHEDDCPSEFAGKINMSSWPSQSARHFLRELIVNAFLLPCLDLIADPDTINHLLIMAFDSQKAHDDTMPPNKEVLLENFIELNSQTLPDSLLQLKLSEVLRDARQYSMFRLYLQDIRGPVHELSFLAEASRIHNSMQRKDESSSQIAYDIWQLFGQFVHDSAPDRIEFDNEIVNEFKAAVECNNFPMLDKIIEKSYQIVYQRMQTDYVISFCQSDSFFGYLCGSPPVSVNELIEQRSAPKKSVTSEGTFSLAQFRYSSNFIPIFVMYLFSGARIPLPLSIMISSTKSFLLSFLIILPRTRNISKDMSTNSFQDEDETSSSSVAETSRSQPVLIIDEETRNINRWKVNISRIKKILFLLGRTVYVYVIDVERTEGKDNETKRWCIYRRFIEFYVLEMKLLEFHGDSLRFTMLPPKKTPMSRNRAFLEQHRLLFQMFLSSLCKQKVLQRSELLFAFLSSSEEFRYNLLLSDLNPWKVVKKMPGKLSREKGQHLRPFLLTLLANTLYTPEKMDFREKFEASDLRFDSSVILFASSSSKILVFAKKDLFFQSWRNGVKRLVNTLQYPRLNKHLSYLILDLLFTKLFPDECP
uniref:Sorting nexin-14 n=1 Tax=Angiostrongylus cantonensis TaxID=6313 RepID=A0A158PBU0_ANGCA